MKRSLAIGVLALGLTACGGIMMAVSSPHGPMTDEEAKAAQSAAGTWELTTINDQPLPYTNEVGTYVTGGTIKTKSDGTYELEWHSGLKGDVKTYLSRGTYRIAKGFIEFKMTEGEFWPPPAEFKAQGNAPVETFVIKMKNDLHKMVKTQGAAAEPAPAAPAAPEGDGAVTVKEG